MLKLFRGNRFDGYRHKHGGSWLDSLREIGEPNVGTYPSDRKRRLPRPIQSQTSACRHSKTGEEVRSVHALLMGVFHIGIPTSPAVSILRRAIGTATWTR